MQPPRFILPPNGDHIHWYAYWNNRQSHPDFHGTRVAGEYYQKGTNDEERDRKNVVDFYRPAGVWHGVAHVEQSQDADGDEEGFYELNVVDQDVDVGYNQ